MRKPIAALVVYVLSSAAPAYAQDFEPAVRVLRQETNRVVDVLKQREVELVQQRQRELERAIAKIREVEAEGQRFREANGASHGFSVILAVGDLQGGTPTRDLPPAASKALADMSQFLPYKSYELLDARWILGSPRSTAMIRGPENREYELELRTAPRTDNEVRIDFYLRDPSQAFPFLQGRELRRGTSTTTSTGTSTSSVRIVKRPGRIIDTTFNMDVGETVVVGTSRLQGDKALIVLLTAVGK